ncbi:extracellular solute-binding protein [Phyllobacterium sp. SB3]|uniref:ABC transporter substrate-binding protein n=1 Tax=Phyllobacterium sp. SB3 TaxID=3156073 RepID=UPI0032AEFDAE
MTGFMNMNRRQLLQAAGASAAAASLGAGKAFALAGDGIKIGTFSGALNDVLEKVAGPKFKSTHADAALTFTARASAEAYPRLLVAKTNPFETGGLWNDTFAALGAKADLFTKVEPANAPNVAAIPQDLQPRHGMGVAAAIQPFGIAYNPKFVEKPKSWLDLFNPKYAGKVGMHENFWDAYVMLARILGKDEYNLSVAVDEWAKHKKNIGVWTTSYTQMEELIDKGEVWLGPQWGGYTAAAQLRGLNIAFAWPEEGCTQQTIVGCVNAGTSPAVSKATQEFVNVWLDPEIQLEILKRAGLSPSNPNVTLPTEYAQLEGVVNVKTNTKKLFQYDFAHVGGTLQALRREIDQKLR